MADAQAPSLRVPLGPLFDRGEPTPEALQAEAGLLIVCASSPTLLARALRALVDHRQQQGCGTIHLCDPALAYDLAPGPCAMRVHPGPAEMWQSAARTARSGESSLVVLPINPAPAEITAATDRAASLLCLVPILDTATLPQWLATLTNSLPAIARQPWLADLAEHFRLGLRLHVFMDSHGAEQLLLAQALAAQAPVADALRRGDFVALSAWVAAQLSDRAGTRVRNGDWGGAKLGAIRRNLPDDFDPLADLMSLPSAAAAEAETGAKAPHKSGGPDPFTDLMPSPPPLPSPTAATAGPHPAARPGASPAPAAAEPGGLLGGHSAAVDFRAFTPAAVAQGAACLVDIWACLPRQWPEVLRRATATGQPVAAGLRSGVAVAEGAVVSVRLSVSGLKVAGGTQSLVWVGEPCNLSFVVQVPADAAPGPHPAKASIAVNGIAIGALNFLLPVAAAEEARVLDTRLRPADGAVSALRSAFASYAGEDRPEMLARVQGMKAVAPDLDVFIDALSLRAGERWMARIEAELRARDGLFLFWSPAASRSEWVRFEWQCMLGHKGLDAIAPVPLADPRDAPPPGELAALHFNDIYLAWLSAARLRPASA